MYKYIKRYYGIQFTPGMEVLFTEYNNAPGKVMRPAGDPAHVRVKFQDGKEGNCHPTSLIIAGEK